MKRFAKPKYSLLFFWVNIIIIAGCQLPSPGYPSNSISLTKTHIQLTETRSTPERISTVPLTKTQINSPQPLPTLNNQEINNQIKNLLSNNGGCELPCWWGITPGKSELSETIEFLRTFTTVSYGHGFSHWIGPEFVNPFSGEKNTFTIYYSPESEKLTGFLITPELTKDNYQLKSLLLTYGLPSQVYIQVYPYLTEPQERVYPAYIFLFYEEQGFLAVYAFGATKKGEDFNICISPIGPTLEIGLPAPMEKYSGVIPIVELRNATDLDVTSFYNIVTQGGNNFCIETPASNWE